MKTIQSKQNQIVKLCGKLAQKKYRDRYGQYLIEGPNLVEEALKNNADIRYLLARGQLAHSYIDIFPDVISVDDAVFDTMAQTETSQGVLAVVDKAEPDIKALQERLSQSHGNVLILDRLQDPGNIGTIIRTADAAGYEAILLIKGTGDIYAPKAVRAAAGSVFRIPAMIVDGGEDAVAMMHSVHRRVYATDLKGAKWYYDEDLASDAAVIIGNEGNGISEELLELADARIKIPMNGNIESLNAGIAAAIIMYEAVRKNPINTDKE